jgi:hypothetical protein
MCSVIILRRPGHPWPVIVAANRDEMNDRPWRPPGRHWPEQPRVTAGLDELGRGTWLGLNDAGLVCGVLNRINTLGPAAGLRSRGALPLRALAQPAADAAAATVAALDPRQYRPFNLFAIDRDQGFWLKAVAGTGGGPAAARIDVEALPEGLSMITAYDLNDLDSPRIGRFLPRFAAVPAPGPERGDWEAWLTLLADRTAAPGAGPGGAMTVVTPTGFGTVSCSLIALPAADRSGVKPIWLFAAGRPGEAPMDRVC